MSPHVRFNCQTAKWIRAKWIRLCIPVARDARVVHQTCPSEDRGRREGRVLGSHPRPVCIGGKHTVVTTGGAGSSGLPCAMVLTASFELSSVTSSFLPPSPRGLNGFTRPVGPTKPPRDLTPATGARTTRLRRPHQCRSSDARGSLTIKSPCDSPLCARHRRVHRIPSQRP